MKHIEQACIKRLEKAKLDVVRMDMPLFIRMLEWAKEEAKTDVELHSIAERVAIANINTGILSISDYKHLVSHNNIT